MSDGERFDEWHAIRKGRARIAIGPRSAVFAPVQNLGLIIVDEEHDSSYKQENSPRYHGRDIAVLRASMEGATIVLGSATLIPFGVIDRPNAKAIPVCQLFCPQAERSLAILDMFFEISTTWVRMSYTVL